MKKFGESIANRCIEYQIIKEESREIVVFGMIQTLFFLSVLMLMMIIAGIAGEVIPAIMYCLIYITISSLSGGYHGKNRITCTFKTLFVFSLYIVVIKYIPQNYYSILECIGIPIYYIILYKTVPVLHKNKVWSEKQLKNNKKKAMILSSLYCFIAFVLEVLFGLQRWTFIVVAAMLINGLLILCGYLFNEKSTDANC